MKIAATSDLHGLLPNIRDDQGLDVLIIAGDIAPAIRQSLKQEKEWYKRKFYPWLDSLPIKYKIFIAGNHDRYWEHKTQQDIQALCPPNTYYLFDSGIVINGISFYGTPWQPVFLDWAFNRSSLFQEQKFALIPSGVDILITHCPPYGFGKTDIVQQAFQYNRDLIHEHLGSMPLRNAILDKKPRYNIFGHIHSGDHTPYNHKHLSDNLDIQLINVSYIDENYDQASPLYIFEIEPKIVPEKVY
jgi:predicted phosphohydrolase